MKNETKAKILAGVNKAYNKVMAVGCSAATAIGTASVTSFAEEGATTSSSSLSDALAQVDPNVVLSCFYEVLPTVLTIALPIIGAKVALNFLFGSVKGA